MQLEYTTKVENIFDRYALGYIVYTFTHSSTELGLG